MIQIILPKRLYPKYQRDEGEPWEENCPTIAELHKRDYKKGLMKKRIRL